MTTNFKKSLKGLAFLSIFMFNFNLGVAQSTSWTGTSNDKWNTSSNWTNGVPDEFTHAIVGDANFTGSNQPVLNGPTAKCLTLTLGNGTKTSSLDIDKNLQVSGDVLIGSNGTINATSNSKKITLTGNWTNNGTYNATKSSAGVIFAGSSSTITGATTFQDMTINAGTTVILAANITILDDLDVSGVLNPTASYAVGGTGTLNLERDGEIRVYTSLFTTNYSISNFVIDDRSTVNYASASTTQYIYDGIEYGYLKITGGSTKELTADLPDLQDDRSTSGRIIIEAGVLDLKTYTADRASSGGGDIIISNDAELWIGGTNSLPQNYDNLTISSTSLVIYYGNNQTVTDANYGNLTLSGTSGSVSKTLPGTALDISGTFSIELWDADDVTVTAGAAITVQGDFSIEEDCSFEAGSYTHTFSGEYINEGTFTGQTSSVLISGSGASITGAGTNEFNNLTFTQSGIYAEGACDIEVTGDVAITGGGDFTHQAGGVFLMSGTSKSISGAGFIFSDLEVSGSVTTAEDITVTGDLFVDGSLSATNNAFTLSGSGSVIDGSGSLTFDELNITGTISTSIDFTINNNFAVASTASFSAGAGTATFAGTSTLSGEASLYDVSISGSSSLILGSNSVLNVGNTISNSGTFNTSSFIPNKVVYDKNGAQTVGALTYYNLELATGGTKSLAGSIVINNDLNVNLGVTLNGGSNTIQIYRHWTNAGTFTASSSDVQFRGSNASLVTGATTYYTLTVNKTSSDVIVNLANDVTCTNITMTQGTIDTDVNTITTTSTRTGNGIILGTIHHSHSFTDGTTYYFEGPNNGITFHNPSGVNSVTVTTTISEVANVDPTEESVTRDYDIDIPSGTYDSATLRLHYEDNELNAFVEPFLAIYKYNTGTTWDSLGYYSRDVDDNYVELGGIADVDGNFMLAGIRNIVRWNGSVSTDWGDPDNWTTISGLSMTSRVPDSNDVAQIGEATFTNQPVITSDEKINVLRFGSAQASTLTISSGSLEIIGSARGNWSTNRSHVIAVGSNELIIGTNLTLSDGVNSHDIEVSLSTGTVTIGYDLVSQGTGAITFTGAGNLEITHDFTYTSGTFTPSTGTVSYIGSLNQDIAPLDYYNLSVAKTTGRARVVQPTNVANDFNSTTGGETAILDSLIVESDFDIGSGTEILEFNSVICVGGDWSSSGTFTTTGGVVCFKGSGAQTVDGTTFNDLRVMKTSGTLTLTDDLIINNSLTIDSGTLDVETYQASRASNGGTFTMATGSVLKVGGSDNFPANFQTVSINSASTVEYDGSVAQNVKPATYGHLSFANGSPNKKTLEGSITVNGNLSIGANAVLDPDTTTITLNGNFSNSGTVSSSQSTLIMNGSSKTFTGTTTLYNFTVNTGSITVSSGTVTMEGDLYIETTGSLSFGSNTAILDGNLTNAGSLTSNGIATFTGTRVQQIQLLNAISSTSSGVINFNGSVAPNISSTSSPSFATVNINNSGGIAPSVPWTVVVAINIGSGATFNGGALTHTIYGDFTNDGTVTSSGKILFSPGAPYSSSADIDLDGTSFQSTGEVEFGGTAPITITQTSPDFNTVTISNTNSSGVTAPGNWTIDDNLIISSGAIFKGGSSTDHNINGDLVNNGTLTGQTSNINFLGDTSNVNGTGVNNFADITIDTNTHLILNNGINVSSDFILHGSIDATGRTVKFNGSTAGTISGDAGAVTFDDLESDKSGETTTLGIPVTVTNGLYLSNGTFTTDATNILTIADDATSESGNNNSYVIGPMVKVGDDAFVFPLGKGSAWARLGISAPSDTADAFTAEYFNSAYANTSSMAGSPSPVLNNVSTLEYWTCDRSVGSSNVTVTLYWQNAGNSGINDYSSDLVVARWNGSAWENAGHSSVTASSPGDVTSNTVSSFSPFTFGSLSGAVNPVPVELISFDAKMNKNEEVELNWQTANELNNDYFTVERSSDLIHWEEVVIVDGAGNSNTILSYDAIDKDPFSGVSYYRLKQTDFDGTVEYSHVVIIDNRPEMPSISLAPNPANDIIKINSDVDLNGQVIITTNTGQEVTRTDISSTETTLDIMDLKPGVYYISVYLKEGVIQTRFIKL